MPIRYIVLHTTQGVDSREWLTRTGGVSAHYLVQRDVVYRLVAEDLEAWHAGRIAGTPTTPLYDGQQLPDGTWLPNPNSESIGIEMEGYAALDVDPLTIRTTAELIWDIRERHPGLPIVNHWELSPGDRTDPGPRNRAAVDALLEEDDMTPEQDALLRNIDKKLDDLANQQTALARNIPSVWLRRMFFGLNPLEGKRRGVNEVPPAEIVVPD